MSLIGLVIWLIVTLLIGAAVLAVMRSVLAWPMFSNIQPYANTVYALIVLLLVLIFVSAFYGGYLPFVGSTVRLR